MLLSCEHASLRLSAANKFFVVYVAHNCVGEVKRRKKLCIHACVCCSPHKLRVGRIHMRLNFFIQTPYERHVFACCRRAQVMFFFDSGVL